MDLPKIPTSTHRLVTTVAWALSNENYTYALEGSAFIAGAGMWTDLQDVEKTWKEDRSFTPSMTQADRDSSLKRWKSAIARVTLKA